jgi:hypothetical protein
MILQDSLTVKHDTHNVETPDSTSGPAPKNGYKKLRISRHETRDEHRVVMERILGFRLPRDLVVHHIDGNKRNNRPENLSVMRLRDHSSLHWSPESHRLTALALKGKPNLKARRLTDSQIEQVQRLIAEGNSTISIASMFGVSKYTIRRIKIGVLLPSNLQFLCPKHTSN